jgi:SAM-dependent methyltransferase
MNSSTDLDTRFCTLETPRLEAGVKAMFWRASGWLGHHLWRQSAPDARTASGKRLLNLGCGAKHHSGWVNADFYRPTHLLGASGRPDWMLDLTRPFRCDADYWDGVSLEHVNEHLLYSENLALLREVHRTLKPGGTLRVAVPSLGRYLNWMELRGQVPKMARYGSLPEATSNLTQNHAHRSVLDGPLLCELLEQLGFIGVAERGFREGQELELAAADGESHSWESVYVEARKPDAPEVAHAA